jgi:uncharacterized protein YndB with AHSA1/START domain
MPAVTRARSVPAEPGEVWAVISDPARLPEWWPGVQRVEEATPLAWTSVLSSPGGKPLRADFTRLEAQPSRRVLWRHEVEESPFERILLDSTTEIALEPAESGSTRVRLTVRQRPRSFARFGFVQMRLAIRRQVEGALDGLESLVTRGRR